MLDARTAVCHIYDINQADTVTTFQLIQLVLQALGVLGVVASLLFTARTLRLNVKAYRDLHDWNRRKAAHDAVARYSEFSEDGKLISSKFSFTDAVDPIPLEKVKEVLKTEPSLRINLHRILNFYEELAGGVRHGVFDEEVVRTSLRTTIMQSHTRFRHYLEHLRNNNRPEAFKDLNVLVERWRSATVAESVRNPTGV